LFLTFVMAKITPNIIIPLFFKYSTVENENLKHKIFKLFDLCKVSLEGVYSINLSQKTKKANAFLCGIGKTRRVVLGDNLLEKFSPDEIEIVIAHELGHYKHRDILKLLLMNSVIIFSGLYLVDKFLKYALVKLNLNSVADIAFFPILVLILMVFSFILMPIINGYSRKIEKDADKFSIEKTNNPQAFIDVMQKLGEMNLSEFSPNSFVEIFLYDHPPLAKRIKFAAQYLS